MCKGYGNNASRRIVIKKRLGNIKKLSVLQKKKNFHKINNAPHNTNLFLINNFQENISDVETDEDEYIMIGTMKDSDEENEKF